MTVFFHELRRGRLSLIVWTAALSFMLVVCVAIYPEMSSQMNEISEMFANMGSFSEAFGIDKINFGDFLGYFAIECGNTLGIGGAIFAAILGTSALAKEERDGTAELLLTHPVSRGRVLAEKLAAAIVQLLILDLAVFAACSLCIFIIGEKVSMGTVALLFLSYFLMKVEIGVITFAISAFVRRGGLGIGIGVAIGFYFLNILSNITEDVEFLKYITPFGYADGTDIVSSNSLNCVYLAIGAALCIASVAIAYFKYTKKDIS